jgi:hypothetical protein
LGVGNRCRRREAWARIKTKQNPVREYVARNPWARKRKPRQSVEYEWLSQVPRDLEGVCIVDGICWGYIRRGIAVARQMIWLSTKVWSNCRGVSRVGKGRKRIRREGGDQRVFSSAQKITVLFFSGFVGLFTTIEHGVCQTRSMQLLACLVGTIDSQCWGDSSTSGDGTDRPGLCDGIQRMRPGWGKSQTVLAV